MMALLLLLQATSITVGDTVRIERLLGALGPVVVRPQTWSLGALGQQLGPAEVVLGSEGTVVRYLIVLWYPGEHLLTLPGPVVVGRNGRSDTLAASTTRVRVTSVLPQGERRSTLPPKPARDPLELESRTPVPALLLLGVIAAGLLPLALRWRRKGQAPGRPAPGLPRPGADIITRWAAAGEYRAALDGWGWILARRLAASRDLAEIAALQGLLDDISFSAFSPLTPPQLEALCARAAGLGSG